METSRWPWWNRHLWTVVLLSLAAGIAFFVRTAWMVPLLQQYGPANLFGGGSDSFYHFRVSNYILQNHRNLIFDPLLNYPNGAINPREPLFDWMNAILGIIFAGAFGGNASNAAAFFLELDGPLWAALGVIPVYLLGKELSDRRVGIVAALLFAFDVANMDSSTFAYANYLSFYLFFILICVYGYLRTIRAAGTRRWVDSYRHPGQIPAALRAFVRTERQAVKWAVFTGVAFGALALAWQGYTFVVAAIVIFLVVALLIERIRRVDSFGLYVTTWIVALIGFPMAAPYYLVQGIARGWLGLPLIVFVGGLLICLPLILLRDQPWVVSIPTFFGVSAIGVVALYFVSPGDFGNVVTGQGYFVKTLVYSTVAEAQAPSIDQLIIGYGVWSFFAAFIGLALWVWRTARGRFPRVLLMGIVFALISIYLPISAAKFFLLGSAAFSILPAEALIRALDVADLPKLRRTISQLSDRRSQAAAFRRAFKARNVLVPVGIALLLTMNAWYAVDAGIAYNYKGTYSSQIYNSLPAFLQTSPANASSFYLGAAGTELDTPPQYDEAGYNWLSQQDVNITPANRPAFVSWWDYGFQAIAQGDHPSVADNFQNGIDPSGNFLLSQNESLAIGVLTTTLLAAEQTKSGDADLPAALNTVLARDNVNLTLLHTLMNEPSYDRDLVIGNPTRYLPVNPNHLDGENAMYDTVSWMLASTRSTNAMAQLYDDVQQYTHWTIRYAMVDDRLFPFSGQDTGIFYAPADLTDRVISSAGIPTTYFNVNITGSDGNTYPYGPLPSGVSAAAYPITYNPAFYNSMIYRIFIGYNATDAGLGTTPSSQIPGITLSNAPVLPGWMLSHFEVVYETAYYCQYQDAAAHPGCGTAMNLPVAHKLATASNGSIDSSEQTYASSGGEMILAYYPGEPLVGTVRLPDGAPVPGVRVTVSDAFGVPHMVNTTGPDGQFQLILPPGNDTLNITTGKVDLLNQQGVTNLLSAHVYVPPELGDALDPTPVVHTFTLAPSTVTGVIYWNDAGNSTYTPSVDPPATGAKVVLWGEGPNRTTTVDASGGYRFNDVTPGTYNVTVLYRGTNYTNATTGLIYPLPGQVKNASIGLAPSHLSGQVYLPDGSPAPGVTVTLGDAYGPIANVTTDPTGNYTFPGVPPGNLTVQASDPSAGLATPPQALAGVTAGTNSSQNLTLEAFGRVSLTVLSNGVPVAGFPVRFSPNLPFELPESSNPTPSNGTGNGTTSSSNLGPIHANGTVLTTGPSGTLTGSLPAGNYSIYGLGLVGGAWSAGLGSAAVAPGTVTALSPLSVAPAARLTGNVAVTNGGVGSKIEILAEDAAGDVAWTFTNDSGDWGLSLPHGTYTLLALQSPSAGYPTAYSQVRTIRVTGDAVVPFSLSPSVLLRPFVGAATTAAGIPAALPGALVELSVPSEQISLSERANASGNVTFYAPESLASGGTFCVNVTDPGYAPYSSCDLSPTALPLLTSIALEPNATTLTIHLNGLPSSGSATVNLTAASPTARSVSLTGGATITTSLQPGTYRVTAYAPAPSGTVGLYEPSGAQNLSVSVGESAPSLTVTLVHVVNASGRLLLPAHVAEANVSITLSSPSYSLRLGAAAFQSHFLVAPGTYSVLATAIGPGTWAAVTTLTFNATGAASAPIAVVAPGTTLALNLSANGNSLANSSLSGRLLGPSGWSIPVSFPSGRYVGVVEANLSYSASVTGTALLTDAQGDNYYASVVQSASQPSCIPQAPSDTCTLDLSTAPLTSGLSGSVAIAGYPGLIAAELSFTGPSGSLNETTYSTTTGAFNVSLFPGTYTVYAHTLGSSALYANISEVTVGPNETTGLTVFLSPAWTDTVTLAAPPGATFDSATLLLVTSSDLGLTFGNLTIGTPTPLVLPIGTYTLKATASGAPYGVAVTASDTASASLYAGNTATDLTLAWQFHRTAVINLPIPYVSIGIGGNISVPFSVVNTGNEPFEVRFTGSPSTFTFTFVPSLVSLGLSPENSSATGRVWVDIPNGTAVAHPPIQLEAIVAGANGTAAGFAQPSLTVNLTATYGLILGQGAVGTASTGPYNVSLPFYLRNTGNVPESVNVTVLDSGRLVQLGWTTVVEENGAIVRGHPSLAEGSNNSFSLELSGTAGKAVPPGTVTIVATVVNGSANLRASQVLSVPTTFVGVVSTGLLVTGPNLGSPPAAITGWVPVLVFVPALAVLGGAGLYRWVRTRRWSRR